MSIEGRAIVSLDSLWYAMVSKDCFKMRNHCSGGERGDDISFWIYAVFINYNKKIFTGWEWTGEIDCNFYPWARRVRGHGQRFTLDRSGNR